MCFHHHHFSTLLRSMLANSTLYAVLKTHAHTHTYACMHPTFKINLYYPNIVACLVFFHWVWSTHLLEKTLSPSLSYPVPSSDLLVLTFFLTSWSLTIFWLLFYIHFSSIPTLIRINLKISLFNCLEIFYYVWVFCLYACMDSMFAWYSLNSEESVGNPGTVVMDGWEPPCGWWETNSGPLHEKLKSHLN